MTVPKTVVKDAIVESGKVYVGGNELAVRIGTGRYRRRGSRSR